MEGGVVRTKGQILAADDRAGIAILLGILRELKKNPLRRTGVQAIYTVSEEDGMGGAEVLDSSRLQGGFAVVLVGLIAVIGGLLLWVELLVRSAIVYLLVALSPLAFAAMVWPAVRGVARRLAENHVFR